MRNLYTILFLLLTQVVNAQEPAMMSLNGYGGNGVDQVSNYVTKTNDGGFIVTIYTTSAAGTGNLDSFCTSGSIFLKYNADASALEWYRCYPSSYIFPTAGNNFIYGGNTNQNGGWAFKIEKTDYAGTLIWRKTYGNHADAILRSMMPCDDGGYIMMGEVNYTDTDVAIHHGNFMDPDLWVIKVDSNGDKVWTKVIGGTGSDLGVGVIAAPNGGCYVTGTTVSDDFDCTGNHGSNDAYLARLDSNGNILWHRDLGGSGDEFGPHAYTNGKGGILIAATGGSGDGDLHHYVQGLMYWVMEIDSSNTILWENCYGGGGHEEPSAICRASDGSIWINGLSYYQGGQVGNSYGHGDGYIVHADSAGNFISSKVLGSSWEDIGKMVYPLSNDFIIMGGNYAVNDHSFTTLPFYNDSTFLAIDAFIGTFANWTTKVSTIYNDNDSLSIFPNPTKEKVNIRLNNNKHYNVFIRNAFGETVYKSDVVKEICIDTKTWAKGFYYIQAIDEEGGCNTEKIIVQ